MKGQLTRMRADLAKVTEICRAMPAEGLANRADMTALAKTALEAVTEMVSRPGTIEDGSDEIPAVEDLELGGGWQMSAADWAAEDGDPPAEGIWARLEQLESELYARAAAEGRLDSGAKSLMTEEHREFAAELREVDEKRYNSIVDKVWA